MHACEFALSGSKSLFIARLSFGDKYPTRMNSPVSTSLVCLRCMVLFGIHYGTGILQVRNLCTSLTELFKYSNIHTLGTSLTSNPSLNRLRFTQHPGMYQALSTYPKLLLIFPPITAPFLHIPFTILCHFCCQCRWFVRRDCCRHRVGLLVYLSSSPTCLVKFHTFDAQTPEIIM